MQYKGNTRGPGETRGKSGKRGEWVITQGELIIILRNSWRARTGGKLEEFPRQLGVDAKTVRNWIAEVQRPSLAQYARMQQLAGTDAVEQYLNSLTHWGEHEKQCGQENRTDVANILGDTTPQR